MSSLTLHAFRCVCMCVDGLAHAQTFVWVSMVMCVCMGVGGCARVHVCMYVGEWVGVHVCMCINVGVCGPACVQVHAYL